MNEKRNRIAAAITVNVILLAVILVAVIIYQIVIMSLTASRRNSLRAEIDEYEQLISQTSDDLEYLQSEQHLLDLALQYGYYFPNND